MIRLSYSTLELVNTCERKFQLEKLLTNGAERDQASWLVGGSAFGHAVAHYMINQDREQAIFEAWLKYFPRLEDEKRTQAKYLNLCDRSFDKLDDILADWEIVEFNGKPAAELSFRININETFYFVGYVDCIIRNKWTGQYMVKEVKHTSSALLDLAPLYRNSGQALGYSIILDKIVGEAQSDYGVGYFVGQMGKEYNPNFHWLPFDKTLLDRLNWFVTLKMDVMRIEQMIELNVFPKRGSACLNYNRPCKHFQTCDLHSLDMPKAEEVDEIEYDFVYELDDLVQDHIERVAR